MLRHFYFFWALCLLASLSLCVHPLFAQTPPTLANGDYMELPGADNNYPYVSTEQDLGDALRVFGRNLQIAVNIDTAVTGTIVESDQAKQTRRQYLDALAEEFGFVWYFDGILLNVVDVASFRTEVFSLQNNNGRDVIDLLMQLDIYQDKFLHRADIKSQALMIMGPSSYVDTVAQAVEAIERSNRKTVTLLRGATTNNFVGGPGFNPAEIAETVDPSN